MRVSGEIGLSSPAVGHVGIQLGRGKIGVSEHLLDAAKVGAALEQMRRERVAEEVRMDAAGLEPGLLGQPPENEERAGTSQWPALSVQEQLRPVATIEVRTPSCEIAAQRLHRTPADRHDPFLAAFANGADEAFLEVDTAALEADGLAHSQACAVEQLHEGLVTQSTRRRTGSRVDEPLGLAGRKRPR